MSNTGIVNVLVSTLYSKPDEVTGYECGLYSTKSNNGCFKIVPLDTLGGVVPINGLVVADMVRLFTFNDVN